MESLRTVLENNGVATESDCPLSRHSTFRIGGNADLAVFPKTPEEMIAAVRLCRASGVRTVIVGNGSNVLFADDGFRGAVIFTVRIRGLSEEPNGFRALCGTSLAVLSAAAVNRALSGVEFACGIPGSVGGSVCMNAGAHGGEMAGIVTETVCYDAESDERMTLRGTDHRFGYRTSVFAERPDLILLETHVRLTAGDREEIRKEMRTNLARRRATQPLGYPSAGSAFKRPNRQFAAKLIEDCGLKGYREGGAEVSQKHAGFIVNRGGATARDVLSVMDHVREVVFRETGISLDPEIRVIP